MAETTFEINVDDILPEVESQAVLDYDDTDYGKVLNDAHHFHEYTSEDNGELSRSEMVLPTTPQLDATVLVISLALEKGIDVERWLIVADIDVPETEGSLRHLYIMRENKERKDSDTASEEDSTLVPSDEFASRMLSLSMVVSTHEADATREQIELGVSPDALSLVEDFFGISQVDIALADSDEDQEDDSSDKSALMFVDVRYFLVYCYENMERVKEMHSKRSAKDAERMQQLTLNLARSMDASESRAAVKNAFRDQITRSPQWSPQRSPRRSPARSPKPTTELGYNPNVPSIVVDDEEEDAVIRELLSERYAARELASAQQQRAVIERSDGVTLTPTSVVSRRSMIEASPYDEEVAFDLDDEDDVTLGSDGRPLRSKKITKSGENKTERDRVVKKRVIGKAEADVLLDLMRTLVRRSAAYLQVRRRLGFVRCRDATSVANYVGPPRTEILPKGFGDSKKKRLDAKEVQAGFTAGHLVLSDSQTDALFQLVEHFSKHMRALYKDQELMRLQEEQRKRELVPKVDLETGELKQGGASGIAGYYGLQEYDVEPSHTPAAPPSPRARATLQGPVDELLRPARASSPDMRAPSASPTSSPTGRPGVLLPTRITSSCDAAFRGSVASLLSATLSTACAQSADFGGTEALTTVAVNVRHGENVWRVKIPRSNARAIYKRKISSEWLDYYLQYLHRAHKTCVLQEITLNLAHVTGSTRTPSFSPAAQDDDYQLPETPIDANVPISELKPSLMSPLPAVLVKALNGEVHLCNTSDKLLDSMVYTHSKALLSAVTLDKELSIRLTRWVGNVDASGDYDRRMRVALRTAKRRQSGTDVRAVTALAPETPESADRTTTPNSGGSGCSKESGRDKALVARVRRLLVSAKRDELMCGERLDATITRELFWKYICYCRNNHRSIADESVCTWDEWLIWRFENFSNTHRDIKHYKQAAIGRLQISRQKSRAEDSAVADLTHMGTSVSVRTADATVSGTRGSIVSTDVAFGRGAPVAQQQVRHAERRSHAVTIALPQPKLIGERVDESADNAARASTFVPEGSSTSCVVPGEAERCYQRWCQQKDARRKVANALKVEQAISAKQKRQHQVLQAKRAYNDWMLARKKRLFCVRNKPTGKVEFKKLAKDLTVHHCTEWNPHIKQKKAQPSVAKPLRNDDIDEKKPKTKKARKRAQPSNAK